MTFCTNAEGEVEASTTMTFSNNISTAAAAAVNAAPPNNSNASSHDDTTIAGPKGRRSSETIQASPTRPLPPVCVVETIQLHNTEE
ncbi:hypothetical protein L3X38_033932 [Prunus dulcis]|uniref:Uncharacterized protein n=1 Tax=Prunus dulcis TaxID=3755 RepID=A0AAD4VIB5_PRUDU|nr:hypothetical protein L3X38_033932 [Prunus dulcis]